MIFPNDPKSIEKMEILRKVVFQGAREEIADEALLFIQKWYFEELDENFQTQDGFEQGKTVATKQLSSEAAEIVKQWEYFTYAIIKDANNPTKIYEKYKFMELYV